MVTIPIPAYRPAPTKIDWRIPTRAEIREQMNHPGVAATAIVAALIGMVTLIVCVTILVMNDKSTDALIGAGAIAFFAAVVKGMMMLGKALSEIRQNTRPTPPE